jgi:SAM-dependent methyltransferase
VVSVGGGKSDSSYLGFIKKARESRVYGFDLFGPPRGEEEKYPLQKIGNIEEGLPYEKDFFDTIYMGEIFEHIHNPFFVLSEVKRVLKKDGVLVLDTPNPYSIYRILFYFFKKSENLTGDPTHLIFYTPKSLCVCLEKSGFQILDLNTRLSKKYKFYPSLFRGLGAHLLITAKKI